MVSYDSQMVQNYSQMVGNDYKGHQMTHKWYVIIGWLWSLMIFKWFSNGFIWFPIGQKLFSNGPKWSKWFLNGPQEFSNGPKWPPEGLKWFSN